MAVIRILWVWLARALLGCILLALGVLATLCYVAMLCAAQSAVQ